MLKEVTTRTVRFLYDGTILTSELLDEKEIEVDDVMENNLAARELTGGEKYLSLVVAAPYTSITHDARKTADNPEYYKNTIAQAIVVKNLASRILGNFYLKFHHPPCPCRLFNDRKMAVQWLQSFLDNNGENNLSSGNVLVL